MRSSKLRQDLDNNQVLELCSKQCGVIGDKTKLKICYLLRHYPEMSVTEIAAVVDASISNVSHSLSKLKSAELVTTRKQSQKVFYSLKTGAFDNLMKVIGG